MLAGDSYLFSDRHTVQFGGEKGKKFKYSKLQKIISENKDLSYNEQKNILDSIIKIWMGDLEQADDMLVVGICF